MAKNKKNQSAADRFGPAVKAFLLCALIGGSGVGYVAQKSKISELGRQIRAREKRLGELQEQNKKFRDQLQQLRLPIQLDARVRDLKLGLGRPLESQIWRLPEPPVPPGVEIGRPVAAPQTVAAVSP